MQLEQNTYRKDSRHANARAAAAGRSQFTRGFVFDSVEIEAEGHTAKADYVVPIRGCRFGCRSP